MRALRTFLRQALPFSLRTRFTCWRKVRASTNIPGLTPEEPADIRLRSRGFAGLRRAPVPIRRVRRFAVQTPGFAPMTIGNGRSCMFTTGRLAALAIGFTAIAVPSFAADVTYERLLNAANEPENWLMVHRDYNNSRHSPLTQINTTTAKDLKPKFIFSIGGRATGGSTLRGKEESTPLVEDGFMYVADTWTRVMKFDVRSGEAAVPLWRYDPKITKSRTNRGIALYGNKVLVSTNDMR